MSDRYAPLPSLPRVGKTAGAGTPTAVLPTGIDSMQSKLRHRIIPTNSTGVLVTNDIQTRMIVCLSEL